VLPLSDVVVSGVPSEGFAVDIDKLKEGAVAINFSSFPNFRPEVRQKAALFVPSVGKVTVRMLQRNLLRLANSYVM
jgi:methylenetetrahydrofolate dehydrogenase (NAD+)